MAFQRVCWKAAANSTGGPHLRTPCNTRSEHTCPSYQSRLRTQSAWLLCGTIMLRRYFSGRIISVVRVCLRPWSVDHVCRVAIRCQWRGFARCVTLGPLIASRSVKDVGGDDIPGVDKQGPLAAPRMSLKQSAITAPAAIIKRTPTTRSQRMSPATRHISCNVFCSQWNITMNSSKRRPSYNS